MVPGSLAGLDQRTGIFYEGEEGSRAGKEVDLMGESMREEHNQRYDQRGWTVKVRM